jgi:hypothetical protein
MIDSLRERQKRVYLLLVGRVRRSNVLEVFSKPVFPYRICSIMDDSSICKCLLEWKSVLLRNQRAAYSPGASPGETRTRTRP